MAENQDTSSRFERIVVLGPIGAGKTTFSRALGRCLGLRVTHLDAHFWLGGWKETTLAEWLRIELENVGEPRWIADGNYLRTLELRLKRATLVVHLDYPPWVSAMRLLWRTILNLGRERDDLPAGCPDRIVPKLFWDSLTYRWRIRPMILSRLELFCDERAVLTFTTSTQATAFVDSLRKDTHQ